MSLIKELKRRNVIRMGILYGISSWLVLQVGDVMFELLGVPDWSLKFVFGILLGTGIFSETILFERCVGLVSLPLKAKMCGICRKRSAERKCINYYLSICQGCLRSKVLFFDCSPRKKVSWLTIFFFSLGTM